MTTFINPHEQVARLEERIEMLEAAIETIHTVRLNWALACPCKCHECDILFEAIRDVLPDSELETSVCTCKPMTLHDLGCAIHKGKYDEDPGPLPEPLL